MFEHRQTTMSRLSLSLSEPMNPLEKIVNPSMPYPLLIY
jgi:hypothetical protein